MPGFVVVFIAFYVSIVVWDFHSGSQFNLMVFNWFNSFCKFWYTIVSLSLKPNNSHTSMVHTANAFNSHFPFFFVPVLAFKWNRKIFFGLYSPLVWFGLVVNWLQFHFLWTISTRAPFFDCIWPVTHLMIFLFYPTAQFTYGADVNCKRNEWNQTNPRKNSVKFYLFLIQLKCFRCTTLCDVLTFGLTNFN